MYRLTLAVSVDWVRRHHLYVRMFARLSIAGQGGAP
jgi:hypothetical protein